MRTAAAVGSRLQLGPASLCTSTSQAAALPSICRRGLAPRATRPPAAALLPSATPPQRAVLLHAAPLEIAVAGEPIFEATGVPLVDELMAMRSLDAAAQHALQRAALVTVGALVGTLLLRAIDRYFGRRIEKKGGHFNALTAAVASAFKPCQVSWAVGWCLLLDAAVLEDSTLPAACRCSCSAWLEAPLCPQVGRYHTALPRCCSPFSAGAATLLRGCLHLHPVLGPGSGGRVLSQLRARGRVTLLLLACCAP